MEQVKSIKKELIYRGSIIDVYKDYVKMPDGKIVEWDFVDHKGAAAVLPITEDGKVVMVKQYRNALNRVTLEIPAGGMNPGESPYESAVRELTEETGYCSDHVTHLKDIVSAIGFCNETIYIYLAEHLKPAKQHLDEDEFLEAEPVALEELVRQILADQIRDAKTQAAVLKVWCKLRKQEG